MSNCLRFFIVLTTLLFFSCNHNSDKSLDGAKNDSIKKYLDLASNDTLPFKLRDQYNSKALSFVDLERNDTLTRWYLWRLSNTYIETMNKKEYFKISKIHYSKSTYSNDTLGLARYYRFRAGFYKNKSISDSSYYYYLKAEKFYKKTNDEYGLAKVNLNKAIVQIQINDFLGADLSTNKAYVFFKKHNYNYDTYCSLVNLGNISQSLRQYNEAIKIFKKTLEFVEKNKNIRYEKEFVRGTCLNNLGNAYRETGNYKKAIWYFEEALKEEKLVKEDRILYGYLLNNIGYCKMKMKMNVNLFNYFDNASKIFDSLNEKNEFCISNVYLSNLFISKRDSTKAKNYSEKALSIAKGAKAPSLYLIALSNAGAINKSKASEYIQEYHRINDSIMFEERKARNQFYKIELETNEISQEKEKAIKQKWVLASIISSILIIVILLFVIFRQKAKQKELQLLQDQQKANEEIYQLMFQQQSIEDEAKLAEKKRIALELHDNIMNKLASTRFNLFAISKKTDETTIKKAIKDIEKIKDIENEIRDITHELNKDVFEGIYSFTTLLEKLIAEQNQLHTTHFELELDAKINWDKVSSKIKMHLYRILQESIHNINKHANATEVTVNILQDTNNLCVSVQDNGVGFDTTKTKDGIGIANIQQRLQQVNGKMTLQSQENKGTSLFITLPI